MEKATASQAEAYLHTHIPLSHAMGVRVVSLDTINGVRLSAPLAPNVNHRNTVFGGSIASVATLACWTYVWAGLSDAHITARIVITRGTTDYLAPLNSDFEALCPSPAPDDWDRFFHTLQRKNRARITLSALLMERDETKTCATFTGDFAAIRQTSATL